MSLLHSFKLVAAKPHPESYPFLAIAGLGACIGRWLLPGKVGRLTMRASLAFGSFCLYFFRDPKRVPPTRKEAIVAPADGRIVSIEHVVPPPELELGDQPRWRIATFLSVLDVHINRMPAAGKVVKTHYHRGKFLNASLDKASDLNERNSIKLVLEDGQNLGVVQIAGLIARRIVCYAQKDMSYKTGERFGLIRFGSRTDLYLPVHATPLVEVGQRMTGGETIMAYS